MSNRHEIKQSVVKVADARNGDVLMPGLELAQAVRDLTDAQLGALLALTATFENHPRYSSSQRYLQATIDRNAL
jgi:hypothetical protein